MRIVLPDPSLLLLVGVSGAGKSTFARARFSDTEIVSSDRCRALVADDEADQTATAGAFAVLHELVNQRLAHRRLTVVDATNLQERARLPLLALARRHHLPVSALVFDLPYELCLGRAAARRDRVVPADVVAMQHDQLAEARRALRAEPYLSRWVLRSPEDMDAATVVREPLAVDRRGDTGPFDVVGDVHGCADELRELLDRLGYAAGADGTWRHPLGRRAVFVGDLVDRGPAVAEVLDIVMRMHADGSALCVPGNHDDKLLRRLRGRNVVIAHGLQQSLDSLAERPPTFTHDVVRFLDGLPSHLVLDGGALVVAHAGMVERLQGRDSRRVRDFALYGDTTGEVDELGLPVRRDWAASYHGRAAVAYGHTPVARAMWVHGTVNLDTGCVFGGALTALRWPERETVSVRARHAYAVPSRPLPSTDGTTGGGASGGAAASVDVVAQAREHAQHEDEQERGAGRHHVHPEAGRDADP